MAIRKHTSKGRRSKKARGGRPKLTKKRDRRMSIALSDSEFVLVKDAADDENLPVGIYVRRKLLQDLAD